MFKEKKIIELLEKIDTKVGTIQALQKSKRLKDIANSKKVGE